MAGSLWLISPGGQGVRGWGPGKMGRPQWNEKKFGSSTNRMEFVNFDVV
jgi:hypothetical protein